VPTDRGYRYFVELLMHEGDLAPLSVARCGSSTIGPPPGTD
jgi:hypothetical protein